MLQSIEAKVIDAQHLQLNHPISNPAGSVVVITIATAEESEQQELYALSAHNLAMAYGADEPDYSTRVIKEPNPDYKP